MDVDILKYYSSASEIQALADFGHNVPGLIICVVAILFLFSELGYKRKQIATFYSAVFIAMPTVYISYVLFGHGLQNTIPIIRLIMTVPEVYLHIFTLIGNLIGGIGEILYVRGKIKSPLGAMLFPVLFLIDGFLSILHPHGSHGHGDIFHNLYGSIMVMVGMLMIIGRLIGKESYKKYFVYLTVIFMLIAGGMLISYTEPEDSFQSAFVKEGSVQTYVHSDSKLYIYLTEFGAVPKNATVKLGTDVTFVKTDDIIVDLESGPHPAHDSFPPLNIGRLGLNEAQTITMNQIGDFGFHDHANPDSDIFSGTITVIKEFEE